MTYEKKYQDALSYIDSYWDRIIIKPQEKSPLEFLSDKRSRMRANYHTLEMPYTYLVPNEGKFKHVFYWDTFFMFRGLIRTKREWVLKHMVNNFIYLYERYGVIPNFNSPASTGRSQPPFLTSMILDTYNGPYFRYLRSNKLKKLFINLEKEKEWLSKAFEVAKGEYFKVWKDKDTLFNHFVEGFELNRYGDRDVGYAHSSELESGWDFTSRFYARCNEFLPIDLNSYLFKYERDFVKIAQHLGDETQQMYWKKRSNERKHKINKFLWDPDAGFFYDYNFLRQRISNFLSLASFMPLWAGMASRYQANKMVKKLKYFETEYGLTATAKESLAPQNLDLTKIPFRYRISVNDILRPKQWDYPNIWPPVEYLTVVGLLKYGFVDDAVRIMKKALVAQNNMFQKHETFFEKFDGATGDKAEGFHYPNQSGFGWTNAIFYRYVEILDAIEAGEEIYTQPKSEKPPYKISILH